MWEKQRLWQRRSFILSVRALALLFKLACIGYLLYLGYHVKQAGFSVSGCPSHQECSFSKILWDWLQPFILLFVLAGAAVWLSHIQKRITQALALEKQRGDLLQTYLDDMANLLMKKNLGSSKEDAEVGKIARMRTLAVLRQLDPLRINRVLSFLRETQLITSQQGKSIVSFSQANMEDMILRGIAASHLDLSGANLHKAHLSRANLSEANLSNALLIETDLRDAFLYKANLRGANFRGADLRGTNLDSANLRRAVFSENKFYRTWLGKANLRGANLRGANLYGSYLSEANLREANLEGVDLRRANLERIDLRGANLRGANLSFVNLYDASLDGANLDGANLRGAILSETNIRQALHVTEEQLRKAEVRNQLSENLGVDRDNNSSYKTGKYGKIY